MAKSVNNLRPKLPSRTAKTTNLQIGNMAMVTSNDRPAPIGILQTIRSSPQKLTPLREQKVAAVREPKQNTEEPAFSMARKGSAAAQNSRRSSLASIKLNPINGSQNDSDSLPSSRPSSRYQVLPEISRQTESLNGGPIQPANSVQKAPQSAVSRVEQIELAFRFSNGKRVVRSFASNTKLRDVFTALKLDARTFELSNNADRVTYKRLDATLESMAITNRTLLLVIPK